MGDKKLENIFNKEFLVDRIQYNALFIMNFESLKDFLIDKVRDFFTNNYEVIDDELVGIPDEKYNNEIRKLDKDAAIASLKWLITLDAINDFDINTYYILKAVRNKITHKFYDTLYDSVDEVNKLYLSLLTNLYSKIDKWFINNVEIATNEDMVGVEYDEDGVIGVQVLMLQVINEAILKKDYNLLDELYMMAKSNKYGKKYV